MFCRVAILKVWHLISILLFQLLAMGKQVFCNILKWNPRVGFEVIQCFLVTSPLPKRADLPKKQDVEARG